MELARGASQQALTGAGFACQATSRSQLQAEVPTLVNGGLLLIISPLSETVK